MPRPLAVAITGGIGAGKTEALRAFERHGVPVLSADEIVHRLYRDDEGVRAELVAAFGDGVVDDDVVDRAALAEIVFRDRAALEELEQILHPRVVREQHRWRDELEHRRDPPAVCAIEVPLLYETAADARFDAVVVITAARDVRAARRATTALAERETRLLPDEEKVRRADFSYVNDGTLEELDAFVATVLERLTTRV